MNKDQLHERKDFRDVRQLVEWAAKEYAERTAYSYRPVPSKNEIVKATFKELGDDVRALATQLIDMGCAGKNCVVLGKFSYDWVRVYFAILSAGAVIVPLDRDWLAPDLADTAKRADADVAVLSR